MTVSDPFALEPIGSDADFALSWCERFVDAHARRDPLAAVLRVPILRRPVAAIYAFARTADDLAGGHAEPAAKAAALDTLEDRLERAFHGHPEHPIFVALERVARDHALPITPLRELVGGLRSEISPSAPATFEALARRYASSVGPIARVLLHIAGEPSASIAMLGERFAVGLRLLDDIVDLRADLSDGRCNLPAEDLLAYGLTPRDLLVRPRDEAVGELVACSAARARAFVLQGRSVQRLGPECLRPLVDALSRLALRTIERLETGAIDPLDATAAPPLS